ncbi:MAG: TylF/MycF/NovP-related O-methyltransferase [Cyanobacteria bacterium P01_H01_bin.15]
MLDSLPGIFGTTYANDNLIALQRTAGFRQDQAFLQVVRDQAQTQQERSLLWRLHTLVWAAQQALHVDGDFVECGVLTGFSFGVVSQYLDFAKINKSLYLYDTFQGIPEQYNSENRSNQYYEQLNAEDDDAIFKTAQKRFANFPNVHLIRGIVPDTFAEACPKKVAFLHLDMNSAASEIAALEILFDKVTPGGLIVFDDYGWSGYRAQKEAEDVFMSQRGYNILELPTGQGLLLKRP